MTRRLFNSESLIRIASWKNLIQQNKWCNENDLCGDDAHLQKHDASSTMTRSRNGNQNLKQREKNNDARCACKGKTKCKVDEWTQNAKSEWVKEQEAHENARFFGAGGKGRMKWKRDLKFENFFGKIRLLLSSTFKARRNFGKSSSCLSLEDAASIWQQKVNIVFGSAYFRSSWTWQNGKVNYLMIFSGINGGEKQTSGGIFVKCLYICQI